MSKNEDAWEILFHELNILETIDRMGHFVITSEQINKYRESRLMTKFDHHANLPKIFIKNSLAILPITRGSYVISRFEAYAKQPFNRSLHSEEVEFPLGIESLNPSNINSESAAINCAFLSGMIDSIAEEKTFATVFGKMSSSKFDFRIRNYNGSFQKISVDNSQCELDGAFEGRDVLIILEAKNAISEDFIVRQLYYPYRLWVDKVSKKIIPVFLCYSNDVFHFFVYKFEDKNDYNSIKLVEQRNFAFVPERIDLGEIESLVKSTKLVVEPDEPFPQADKFERVVDILSLLKVENLRGSFITSNYDFDPRQTNYYTSAGKYLGLISGNSDEYSITKSGSHIMGLSHKAKCLSLAKSILSHKPFNEVCAFYLNSGVRPPSDLVVSLMKDSALRYIESESTFERRSRTVISWVEWILRLAEPM